MGAVYCSKIKEKRSPTSMKTHGKIHCAVTLKFNTKNQQGQQLLLNFHNVP